MIFANGLKLKLSVILILMSTNLSWAKDTPVEDLSYKKAMEYFESQKFEKTIDVLIDLLSTKEKEKVNKEAIDKHPDEDSFHILMAQAYERLNKKSEARDHYDKAIKLNTNDVWAYIGRATASENDAEQIHWATLAIEKFPYRSTAAVALLRAIYGSQAIQE